jgi:carbonic anhydrase
MEKLLRGILHFRRHELPARRAIFAKLAEGQAPDTLFIACCDSRVVPNLFSATEPGDLFAVRTIGNLMPPDGLHHGGKGDVSEGAALEYSLQKLRVTNIIVCGHSMCGAMEALLARQPLDDTPNLKEWLELGKPSLDRFERATHIDPTLLAVDRLSQVNVLQQLDHLRTYRFVREREDSGEVHLHGWWFDVATGETHIYDEERGGFVLLDDDEAERILENRILAPHLTLDGADKR